MNIYLIRHGKAVDRGDPEFDDDEDRPLTDEGETQSRQLGQAFRQRGIHLDVVATSPLVRARRTAELLVEGWPQPAPELVVSERLAPESSKPRKLARLLREFQRDAIAVVGHQPDLSTWASWLIGSKKAYVDFAKGGAAHIIWESELKKGGGALVWLVTPKWFGEVSAPVGVDGR